MTKINNNIMLVQWGRKGAGPRFLYELGCICARMKTSGLTVHLSGANQSEWHARTVKLAVPSCHINTYTGMTSAFVSSIFTLPLTIFKLVRYLRTHDIGVVVSLMSHMWSLPLMLASRISGAQYIAFSHDALSHPGDGLPMQERMFQMEYRYANHVVALSQSVSNQLVNILGIKKESVTTLFIPAFSPLDTKAHKIQKRTNGWVHLLFFGRIVQYKGLELLLDAFLQLEADGVAVTLCIAGEGELPISAAFKSPNVRVVNRWIMPEETGQFLAEADLLVTPYIEASQSGIIPEAMAFGLPVVSTRVGGLAEQVDHLYNGILSDAITGESIKNAIQLALVPGMLSTLATNALATSRGDRNWESMLKAIVGIATLMQTNKGL